MMRAAGESRGVTVIIATYNRKRMLRCAIQSALQQQVPVTEILVVGDHCTDGSAEVVEAFGDARVRWLNRDRNCGSQWGPNNDGIASATSESIAFLGHDDLWFPWHLAGLLPALDGGADLAHPMGALVAPEGVRGAFTGPADVEGYATTTIPPSGWLVRKTVLQAVGGFRDQATLSRGTDDDLFRRIERAGYRIDAVPRLSVLKFPSHWWGAYSAAAPVPQEQWLEAIAADAAEVERQVLTSAVRALGSATPYATPLRAIKLALRVAARGLLKRLDTEKGIIGSTLRARFRYQRRVLRRRRGL
jgi:hypothetical protein